MRGKVVDEPQGPAGGSIPDAVTRSLSSLHDERDLHQQRSAELMLSFGLVMYAWALSGQFQQAPP